MFNLIYVVVLVSSAWVYFDARKIGARSGLIPGFFNLGPMSWALACILLWIFSFPAYLVMRPKIISANNEQSSGTPKDELPQSGVNTAAKIIVIGWSLLFAIVALSVVFELGELVPTSGNQFEEAGFAIGATLGLGMYFLLWAVVAVPVTIVYFLTRKTTPAVIVNSADQYDRNQASKKCPFCAEIIREEAIICRFCKNDLNEKKFEPPITKQQPNQPTTDWLSRARSHIKNEEIKESIYACTKAITANPGGDEYYLRAVAYSKIKDQTKMQKDLEAAAALGHKKSREALQSLVAGRPKAQCQ